jgi:hypothetical protein
MVSYAKQSWIQFRAEERPRRYPKFLCLRVTCGYWGRWAVSGYGVATPFRPCAREKAKYLDGQLYACWAAPRGCTVVRVCMCVLGMTPDPDVHAFYRYATWFVEMYDRLWQSL